MKKLKTEKVDLFVSNDVFNDLEKRLKKNSEIVAYLTDKLNDLYREDENFQKYIEVYSEISGLSGFAMLEADGDDLASFDEGYRDGKKARRVQRWIDEHDGKYACLFLCVSGISEKSVRSAESLLFIPDHGTRDDIFYLFSPLHDEVIDLSTIDYFVPIINELKELSFEEAKEVIEERRLEEWLEVSGLAEEE